MYRIVYETEIDGEDIMCMATVAKHIKPNFSISVNPDAHREGTRYFKYRDSTDPRRPEHMCRINMRKPEKVYHRNSNGAKEWILNSKDKKWLCKFLDEVSKQQRSPYKITNWLLTLYHWNNEFGFLDDYDFPDQYSSKLEAFVNGWYDTEENLSNPSYVASNLERPDYMLLEN